MIIVITASAIQPIKILKVNITIKFANQFENDISK